MSTEKNLPPATNNLLTDLVAAWELTEASGTRFDSEGSNNLTDNNTVGQGVGLIGNCADFERSNSEWLETPSTNFAFADDFTLEAWVNLESIPASQSQWIVNIFGSNNNSRMFALYLQNDGDFDAVLYMLNNNIRILTNTSASISTWYQLVLRFDSSAALMNFKVNDNTAVTTGTGSGELDNNSDGEPLAIGRRSNGQAGTYFDGRIGPVRIWEGYKTDAEVTDLYNSGGARPFSYFQ